MHGRTLAFVILAMLIGGALTQIPSALGASGNPLSALWDAIFDLQSKDKQLQAQIDELKSERNGAPIIGTESQGYASDPYAKIEIETPEQGHALVHLTAGNNGPDRAAGVKLTAFYLMPLFEINSIDGDGCANLHRGIIQCTIGTLEPGTRFEVTIDVTAKESGKANSWTVDISTTTKDSDYTNNHVMFDYVTDSGAPLVIIDEAPIEQAVQQVQPPSNSSSGTIGNATGENYESQSTEQPSNSTNATTNSTSTNTSNSSSSNSSEQSSSQGANEQPAESSSGGSDSNSGSDSGNGSGPSSGDSGGSNSTETVPQ